MSQTSLSTVKVRSRRRVVRGAAALAIAGLIGFGVWAGYEQLRVDALRRAAEEAAARRDHAEALALFERYLAERPSDAEAVFLAARAARRSDNPSRAKELLDRAQRLGWVANAIVLERSLLRVQRGGLQEEEGWLHTCLERGHPDSVLILEALSLAYYQVFNIPAAGEMLEKWAEADKDNPAPLVTKGDLEMWVGLKSQALESYTEAVRRGPDDLEARIRCGELLLELHRAPDALSHYEAAVRRRPEDHAARLGLARCRIELGDVDAARGILDELLRARPDDHEALHERGRLELLASDPARAEPYLRQAAAKAQLPNAALYHRLAQCLEQLGRPEEARKYFEREQEVAKSLERLKTLMQEIGADPKNVAARCEVGLLYIRNGHPKMGAGWLHTTLLVDPTYVPAHEALTAYYEDQKDLDRAALHRELARRYATNAKSQQKDVGPESGPPPRETSDVIRPSR
jgi:tetratricopeptide (TPR) repeat protein